MSDFTKGPPGIDDVLVLAKCPSCGKFHKCKRGDVVQNNGLFLHICDDCTRRAT